jgi:hypothetical protein
MKTARLITLIGSVLLVVSAAFHTAGYRMLLKLMQSSTVHPPLDGILKACWLTFSVLLFALGLIAYLARNMERGALIVLITAAANAVCAALLWRFLGFFPGVYLLAAVTILLALGGALQVRHRMQEP